MNLFDNFGDGLHQSISDASSQIAQLGLKDPTDPNVQLEVQRFLMAISTETNEASAIIKIQKEMLRTIVSNMV